MTGFTQHPDPERLMAWSDHELTRTESAEVDRHLRQCDVCRTRIDEWARVSQKADEWTVEAPAPSVRTTVLAAATVVAATRRQVPRAGQHWWQRRAWQTVAAVLVLGVGMEITEVTLCGKVLCTVRDAETSAVVSSPDPAADLKGWWQAQPRVDLGVPSDGAAVLVTWFIDYNCPACVTTDETYLPYLEDLAARSNGVVKLVVRDWPWNAECNPRVETIRGHESSCVAAIAMRLAAEHGTQAALRRWLLDHQGASPATVRAYLPSVGVHDFNERYPDEVQMLRQRLAALATAVPATPTCYVNGVRIADARGVPLSMAEVGRVIEFERQKRQK
jgi:hypothetical protein